MAITEINGVFHCDCGFSWKRFTSGSHDCGGGLRAKLADMEAQLSDSESKCAVLAAENAVRQEFIQTCFRAVADGGSMDGADIQELGERLGLFGRETYQPVLHGYICGHEAGEDTVYVMKKTPATDAFLAEVRASGVDAAIKHLSKKFKDTGHIGIPAMALEWLAQEIRKGVAL
jgi:hypothetical protein